MALDRDPNHVFRDFVTDGLPSSGSWNPRKLEIRQLLTEWWQTLIALVADAGELELPNLLISMTVTGGDENNIVAEANLPVPSSPGVAVFSIVIEEANTGPVTINGKPLLSNTGNPLVAGALAADGIYLFLDNGDSYRLLSDYVSSSIVAAAEAAQQAAENAQSAAEAARDAAEGAAETVVVARYNSKAAVEAATVDAAVQSIQLTGYYAAGDGGGALYKRVETEPAHAGKIQSADGAWWEIAESVISVKMLGAKGDGVTDDTAAIQAAINIGPKVFLPAGVYIQSAAIGIPSNRDVFGAGEGVTTIRFVDGGDKVHHSIVSANAMSLDARLATDANYTSLVNGYVENSSLSDLTIDANTFNRVKTYNDREQGTAVELHSVRNFVVQRVTAINGPQHNLNVRAATISYMKGRDYVAPMPSQYVRFLDCTTNNQEIDDGITTHDSEYIWIERCVVRLDNAKDMLGKLTAQNGIEVDDGSRYVWVTDCYVNGHFGGYQAKGHADTATAHHVWFTRCVAEDVHHGWLLSAVGSTDTSETQTLDAVHHVYLHQCGVINAYNFINASAWETASHFIQLLGCRYVYVTDFFVQGKTTDQPNTNPTQGWSYIRFRENNKNVVLDGLTFTKVDERPSPMALIQAQSGNQIITIKNVKVDKYTKGPVVETTDAGVHWTVDKIELVEGSSSHPVVKTGGVGGGTLRVSNIRANGARANCQLGSADCVGYVERDVNSRLTSTDSIHIRLVGSVSDEDKASLDGVQVGVSFQTMLGSDRYDLGRVATAIIGNNDLTTTDFDTRLGFFSRGAGAMNLSARMWMGTTAFYPNEDSTGMSLGSPGRKWSTVYAATGTINTSDARDKDWRGGLNEAEIRVAKALAGKIGVYRWKYAIDAKGDDARLHIGVLAQEVIEAFEAENLDPFRYGLVCHDEWEAESEQVDENGDVVSSAIPAGERYGIRYDELMAFIAAGFEARLSALEGTA